MLLIPVIALAQFLTRGPQPFIAKEAMPDTLQSLAPCDVRMTGWLGHRIEINETKRLVLVDLEPLLAGYRHKPGSHPWIGEHIGKWLHAATLAWSYTGDPKLKARLDNAVADLIATQEADGYLGTYEPAKRFGLFEGADWDVWSHKYNLIGLLTYYQYTSNKSALNACRRMGDLLIDTFGPGKKSILSAGTHMGMAATSVLEPIVLLYRDTNDHRYLEFAEHIVRSWNEPNGPRILTTLLNTKQVNKTANGKAYEMLSNLVGLCELARVTGKPQYLQAVQNAWNDITAKRLYITGSASTGEHFVNDFVLPNQVSDSIAETCVTVTWMQLNLQLLRLTGQAKFGEEFERSAYNHLAAAQNPNGSDWCYYTPLQGRKPYDTEITCCHSSGPRGMALAPTAAYFVGQTDGKPSILIDTFESSSAHLVVHGNHVSIQQSSEFPLKGRNRIRLDNAQDQRLSIGIRAANWAAPIRATLNGHPLPLHLANGWLMTPFRKWTHSDELSIRFTLGIRTLVGDHSNSGTKAATWGPFVMAYDAKWSPGNPIASRVGRVSLSTQAHPTSSHSFDLGCRLASPEHPAGFPARLVPFADAGSTGGLIRVWIPNTVSGLVREPSLFENGKESRSREGNVAGSILTDDPEVFVVTYDNHRADRDWFAVQTSVAQKIKRIEFMNGHIFHDGGWFDTSKGLPVVEVQRTTNGPWEAVGKLASYPRTTSSDPKDLINSSSRTFTLKLEKAVQVFGIRVSGVPASGDRPEQSFASCAALRAYAK